MKRGDVVKIYENPVTKTKIEGEAKLMRLLKTMSDDLEQWEVHFTGDSPGSYVERAIFTANHITTHKQ
jgi:hypothetical protein